MKCSATMRAWLGWHLDTQESCYSTLCTHFPIEWCDNLMRAASHCSTIALSCFFSLCFFAAWSFRAVWTVWTVGCRNSCTKETLALPCLQRHLETSSFFDISWKFSPKPCEYQRIDHVPVAPVVDTHAGPLPHWVNKKSRSISSPLFSLSFPFSF